MNAGLIAMPPDKDLKALGRLLARASNRLQIAPDNDGARALHDAVMAELIGRTGEGVWSMGAPSLLVRDRHCVAMVVRDENHRSSGCEVHTVFVNGQAQQKRFRNIAKARDYAESILKSCDVGSEERAPN